ncbi:M20/M25/M40 family metallo-hydrolase [Nocardioides sp.]|uniref:M20/M25/M40 family metallo-hydrolase n=1 Tax=Nocardioides sp. TaxID=35761 RepID=UPI002F42E3C8
MTGGTDRAVAKLQALVRIPSVSDRDTSRVEAAVFDRLHAELRTSFPLLHERLELTRVYTHGLLFRWPGRAADKPVVLMAHLDVVPVDDSAPWQHPAFGAEIVDGAIWGRGTLDDKGCVAAICEAVERLLEGGHLPAQDVWLSFGCDEEISGPAAVAAVDELVRRGVRPWLVLDEGGAVAHDAFPGVKRAVAAIGVAEKGTTSVELRVEGPGGHSSTPARNGPTVRLARAILRIDRSPMPARLPDTTVELMRRLAPYLPLPLRPLVRRADRARPLLARAMISAGAEAAAMARTTFAVTTLDGSPALNVIASSATAGVNVRVMPGDTVDDVLAHLRTVVDDPEVRIRVVERGEASPVSVVDEVFDVVADLVATHFPDAVIAPYVQTGATDSRHFTRICEHVYRFAPFRMTAAQRRAIHSYDEHLDVAAFLAGIDWYQALIEGLPMPESPGPHGRMAHGHLGDARPESGHT